jgi:hypothetical protein
VTGGPELLHQLVAALKADGIAADMVYLPFDQNFEVPPPYRRYVPTAAHPSEIVPGSTIVIPEVMSREVSRFPGCRKIFWWLSVDNFIGSITYTRKRYLLPSRLLLAEAERRLRKHVDLHLYQSHYARLHLLDRGLGPSDELGDYLAADYLDHIRAPLKTMREDIVAFNPVKGRAQSSAVFAELETISGGRIRPVPIVNMDRSQVVDLLSQAKVYIDFGNHPGKDRIPREAAALGACVVTNRRGSAENDVDVPVPARYKIDDRDPGFARTGAELIQTICGDYDHHRTAFDAYRRMIADEPRVFVENALRIFSS